MKKHKLYCNKIKYETIFRIGDRVEKDDYIKVMVIECVDEYLTKMLNRLHWEVVDEDYLLGKNKSTHAEPVCDSEIRFAKPKTN